MNPDTIAGRHIEACEQTMGTHNDLKITNVCVRRGAGIRTGQVQGMREAASPAKVQASTY